MDRKPEVFIEVIDPVTGRKVVVRVSFKSDWQDDESGARVGVAKDVRRIASDVARGLTFGGRFDLSDIDEGDALG